MEDLPLRLVRGTQEKHLKRRLVDTQLRRLKILQDTQEKLLHNMFDLKLNKLYKYNT